LSRNKWIREIHRWLSIVFTVAVLINIGTMTQGEPPLWVGLLALAPLTLLWCTGMYLFFLPYAIRWRSGRRTG